MLVGYAPFCSKETSEVCFKVLNWKDYLKIPKKVKLSEDAKDLIFKMINNSEERLGKKGPEEIKKHPFFKGVDWNNIRNSKAPFVPELKNEYDTKYFEKFEEIEAFYPNKTKNKFKRKDVEYLGYDFNKDNFENDLKAEYEHAMNTINNELKKQKINLEENNKHNDENIDINIKFNNRRQINSINNINYKNKNTIKEIVITKGKPELPLKRVSTTNANEKIPKQKDFNIKLINLSSMGNINNRNNKNFKHQCTIPISYPKKHKLNIIQLPKKKNRPKIYLSSKIRNILNDSLAKSNKNTINILDDSINSSNNNTYRSRKSSYHAKKINNVPINNIKGIKNNKLIIGSLCNNLKRMISPKQNVNIFRKKILNIRNSGISRDKFSLKNTSFIKNKNIESNRIIKSESSKVITKQININKSRNIIKKNNFLKKDYSLNYNKKNFTPFNILNRNNYSCDKDRSSYIYKKKK